jgi:ribosome-associated protein
MIEISPTIQLGDEEVEYVPLRSSGPGGQNVNKVSTAIQLRVDVLGSASMPPEVKQRLVRLAGRRLTSDGVIIIKAQQYRTQEQNRQAALDRLKHLILQASRPPRPRHKTKPSHSAILRRLESKRKRGDIKRIRRGEDIGG